MLIFLLLLFLLLFPLLLLLLLGGKKREMRRTSSSSFGWSCGFREADCDQDFGMGVELLKLFLISLVSSA